MKNKIKYIAIFLLILFIALGAFFILRNLKQNILVEYSLSKEQREIVNTLGYPAQFFITYLPQGEGDLVRTEVWYYPDYQMKTTFLNGKTFAVEEFLTEDEVVPTTLKPEDYYFAQTYDEVEDVLGMPVEPLDFLPGFYEPGEIETYVSKEAIFIFEQTYLTYFQTIGLLEEGGQ